MELGLKLWLKGHVAWCRLLAVDLAVDLALAWFAVVLLTAWRELGHHLLRPLEVVEWDLTVGSSVKTYVSVSHEFKMLKANLKFRD